MENGRKPNICPRMRYRERALSSKTWSIFIYIYLGVETKNKKYSKQMPAWAGGAIKQTGQQSPPKTTGNPCVGLDLSLPATLEFHSQLPNRVSSQLLWSVSFICTTRDWHWPASAVIGNIHSKLCHFMAEHFHRNRFAGIVSPSKVSGGIGQLASPYISNSWCSHVIV